MDKKYHKIYNNQAKRLVEQMTIEEKTSQLCHESPAIERLNIPSYNWWNEALHGIGRSGIATIFPQSIGLGATFDKKALFDVGKITSTEGRIKYNLAQKQNDRSIYKGLTFWEPNINIYRDPRWGRGHETYGEDPYLTAVLGENTIIGLQDGEDDKYFKAAACVKHFAVHSGPEDGRHGFDSVVSDFDLHDTYLPAFKWCIERSDVESVMGAYNMINGIPSCASPLIKNLIRDKWHFKGYFVSDCGALADMHEYCLYTHTAIESATLALKAGCDLNCGIVYLNILQAYYDGKVTQEDIDIAVTNLIATRIKLGLLDENCSYNAQDDILKVECKEHLKKSYEIAVKSVVMLKNEILPLKKSNLKTIGVIGPNATSIIALEGNYNGKASTYHTVLDGIKENCKDDVRVLYAKGCHLYKDIDESCANKRHGFSEAISVAESSDVVVMVMGLDSTIEGEQGDACNEYGAGDKLKLSFPGLQQELMEKVKATGKKLILVVLAGGALDLSWAKNNADAILYGWYPGVMGGTAIADIIFGDKNPSGKTPVTFYNSLDDLPDFSDYSMEGRTYRYLKKAPLYEFGFGLSYTTYECTEFSQQIIENNYSVTAKIKNTGNVSGEAVIQIYAKYGQEKYITPNKKLCEFMRMELAPIQEKIITIPIDTEAILLTDVTGEKYVPQNLSFSISV